MKKHIKHFLYIMHHKIHVLIEGRRLGIPYWRLITHDLSKFSKLEWYGYTNWFYGPRINGSEEDSAFRQAYSHHIANNTHHWQHWVLWNEYYPPDWKVRYMPPMDVKEMVADLLASGIAKRGPFAPRGEREKALDAKDYYLEQRSAWHMHQWSREFLEELLEIPAEERSERLPAV